MTRLTLKNPDKYNAGTVSEYDYQLGITPDNTPLYFEKTVEAMGFSTRICNSLKRGEIYKLGDFRYSSIADLLKIKGFGQNQFEETIKVLKEQGGWTYDAYGSENALEELTNQIAIGEGKEEKYNSSSARPSLTDYRKKKLTEWAQSLDENKKDLLTTKVEEAIPGLDEKLKAQLQQHDMPFIGDLVLYGIPRQIQSSHGNVYALKESFKALGLQLNLLQTFEEEYEDLYPENKQNSELSHIHQIKTYFGLKGPK